MVQEAQRTDLRNAELVNENVPISLAVGHPLIVDRKYILQVHYSLKDPDRKRLGIFAKRSTKVVKRGNEHLVPRDEVSDPDKISFLTLIFPKRFEPVVEIGSTQVQIRNFLEDEFILRITSEDSIEVRRLDHDLDARDKREAESLLSS